MIVFDDYEIILTQDKSTMYIPFFEPKFKLSDTSFRYSFDKDNNTLIIKSDNEEVLFKDFENKYFNILDKIKVLSLLDVTHKEFSNYNIPPK